MVTYWFTTQGSYIIAKFSYKVTSTVPRRGTFLLQIRVWTLTQSGCQITPLTKRVLFLFKIYDLSCLNFRTFQITLTVHNKFLLLSSFTRYSLCFIFYSCSRCNSSNRDLHRWDFTLHPSNRSFRSMVSVSVELYCFVMKTPVVSGALGRSSWYSRFDISIIILHWTKKWPTCEHH